jgi:predicted nucleic acid-binding protein
VGSAERTYVDPSALRSLYVHDDRSKRFARWRARAGNPLPLTRFGRTEIVNSFQLDLHRGFLTEEDVRAAMSDLGTDIEDGRLVLVDSLFRRTLDLACQLSERHSSRVGTRTLDVIHVASALTMKATHFVTYDDRQASLAKAIGLRTLSP